MMFIGSRDSQNTANQSGQEGWRSTEGHCGHQYKVKKEVDNWCVYTATSMTSITLESEGLQDIFEQIIQYRYCLPP